MGQPAHAATRRRGWGARRPRAVTRDPLADRGLKRLALIPVSAAEVQPGPTVDAGSTTVNARAVMKREGVDWVAVVDQGRPRGWISEAELDRHDRISEIEPTRFPVAVKP